MSDGDADFENIETRSVAELARSVVQASDGSYGFLIGAGVSRPEPAEIPTAGELVETFQEELYEEQASSDLELDEWVTEYADDYDLDDENDYGFWFSKARPTPGTRREEIEALVEGADPPFGQIILASMMDNGIISHTITPNFDNLLFKSSHQYADERPFLIDHQAKAPQFRLSDGRSAIVKVHGDYLHYTQNTAEETADLDENIRDLFQQTISEYGLIVLGYGGADDSLMNVLENESISEHGLFWCQREESDLPDRVKELLSSSENAYLVRIEGSESLFGTLWSDIERVKLPQPDDIMERAASRRDRIRERKDEYLGETPTASADSEESDQAEIKNALWEARRSASEEEYEEALNILDGAIDNYNSSAKLYGNRGAIYGMLGEYEKAIEDYNRAIELDPEYENAYSNRGSAYANLDMHERAIEDYDRAIELDPEYAAAYSNRGNSYSNLDMHERAIKDYNRAIEIDSNFTDVYLNKSETEIIFDEPQDAKETAKAALEASDGTENIAIGLMLLLISKTLLREDTSEEWSDYREVCSESFVATWSFDELDEWLASAELEEEIEEEIREIIDRLREHAA